MDDASNWLATCGEAGPIPAELQRLLASCHELLAAAAGCRAPLGLLSRLDDELLQCILTLCDAGALRAMDCTCRSLRHAVEEAVPRSAVRSFGTGGLLASHAGLAMRLVRHGGFDPPSLPSWTRRITAASNSKPKGWAFESGSLRRQARLESAREAASAWGRPDPSGTLTAFAAATDGAGFPALLRVVLRQEVQDENSLHKARLAILKLQAALGPGSPVRDRPELWPLALLELVRLRPSAEAAAMPPINYALVAATLQMLISHLGHPLEFAGVALVHMLLERPTDRRLASVAILLMAEIYRMAGTGTASEAAATPANGTASRCARLMLSEPGAAAACLVSVRLIALAPATAIPPSAKRIEAVISGIFMLIKFEDSSASQCVGLVSSLVAIAGAYPLTGEQGPGYLRLRDWALWALEWAIHKAHRTQLQFDGPTLEAAAQVAVDLMSYLCTAGQLEVEQTLALHACRLLCVVGRGGSVGREAVRASCGDQLSAWQGFASGELRQELGLLEIVVSPPGTLHGHALAPVHPQSVYGADRCWNWTCDVCKHTVRRGDPEYDRMYHCVEGCWFDACEGCVGKHLFAVV